MFRYMFSVLLTVLCLIPSHLPVGVLDSKVLVSSTPTIVKFGGEEETDTIMFIAESDPTVGEITRRINEQECVTGGSSNPVLTYTSSSGLISFSTYNYKTYVTDKRQFMMFALSSISESNLGEQRKNKLYNFVERQDSPISAAAKELTNATSPNMASATAWLGPITGPLGTAMGIIAIVIFAALSFSILFDLAYLSLPFVQNTFNDEDKVSGKLVTPEARSALKESIATGQNEVLIWMRKRVLVFVLVGVVLMAFLLGRLFAFMGWFLNSIFML